MDEEQRRREEQRELEEQRKKGEQEEQRKEDEQRRREEQKRREQRARREKERMRRDEEQRAKRAEYVQRQQRAECHAAYRKWEARRPSAVERRRVEDVPEPPAWPCDDPGCADRRIKACKHSLQRLYRAWDSEYFEILKKERSYWHPDNFEPFEDSRRRRVKEKVTEMFQIINSLYEAEQR